MAAPSSRLLAVALPPAAAGPVMRALWARGDALLPLDPAAPATHGAILATLRPDAVLDGDVVGGMLDEHQVGGATDELQSGGGTDDVADDVEATSRAPMRGPSDLAARLWRASRPLDRPLPTDPGSALVVATSGSTGRPKGVVLDHDALRASVRASLERLGASAGDRWALALPTHHIAGLSVWLRSWAAGTEPLVLRAEDARDPMATLGAGTAYVSLVPTQLQRWLQWWMDRHGERRPDAVIGPGARWPTVLLGGGPAPADLLPTAQRMGVQVVTSYGMTETCGGCVYDGRPLDGVEVRTEGGLIGVRGDVLARGYRGTTGDGPILASSTDEGWFTTNDLGRFDADGRLRVLGRTDDVVVSGGENIALGAVREAVLAHPDVTDAAVAGRPDERWGHVVVAVVVAAPSAPTDDTALLARLRDAVASTLPRTWAPRLLVRVDALPRDAMGKIPRARLAELVGAAVA